jgi:hypothetical protein
LLAEIVEETKNIYTEPRLAAQRKLEDFYKKRGYFTVNVQASGNPEALVTERSPPFSNRARPSLPFRWVTVSGLRGVKPRFY